jgi:hypothetical protein
MSIGLYASHIEDHRNRFRRWRIGNGIDVVFRFPFCASSLRRPDLRRKVMPVTVPSRYTGYGNFVSGNTVLGFPITHHWDARAGY